MFVKICRFCYHRRESVHCMLSCTKSYPYRHFAKYLTVIHHTGTPRTTVIHALWFGAQ